MFEIQIADRQSLLSVDPRRIEEIVRDTLSAERVADAEIVVALLDDAAIHEVNRTHLNHDYPTDVISFLYSDPAPPLLQSSSSEHRGDGKRLDGEVLVSTQTALQHVNSTSWSAQDELTLYLVHGLLHLCGYDDQTPQERRLMRSRERAILKIWNLTPP